MGNKLAELSALQVTEQKMVIMSLVRDWFWSITEQKSENTLLQMLAGDFELIFPDSTLRSVDEFKHWYTEIKATFFNQQHLIRSLDIQLDGDIAHLSIWVNWLAEQRALGQPQSQQLNFDALQRWQLKYLQGKWLITNYKVVELKNNINGEV